MTASSIWQLTNQMMLLSYKMTKPLGTNCHSGQPNGRLSFNTDKCKVLTVKLGNRTQFSIQYEINEKKTLEALESHPYLGVELTKSLN